MNLLRKLSALLRTTAARLSALYVLLFMACAVVLVVYMTSFSVRLMTAQTQATIEEEASGLVRAYQRGGVSMLARAVELRSRQPSANLYLIADSDGRILAGNVESLEPGVLEAEGWTEQPFVYDRFGESGQADALQRTGATGIPPVHAAIALVFRLPNRMIVLVGRDLGEPERFRDAVRNALMAALGIMGLGALAIWLFVGRRALKRIDEVLAASRKIMGGDLTGRLPVSGVGDEFDRLSENLNAMLARIAELNEGLKQVSDNIAHDLKTPLTRLRNRAEAALGSAATDDDYRAALESTIAESEQLIKTFNAILMISRLEAGQSAEPSEMVELSDTLRDVVELYEPVAEEMGVALEGGADGSFAVSGNRELIGQALSNIVDNAIKYSAGLSETPRVRVELARRDGLIVLTVADNGPGIPDAAERERATERFVRLEQSRSRPGSGLGLSLAKAIMKFHGGRLELSDGKPGLVVSMIFPGGAEA